MILETIPAIGRLTAEQKLLLVNELWRDVSAPSEPVSPEFAALLEERVAEYRADPDNVLTTEQVTARIMELKQRLAAGRK